MFCGGVFERPPHDQSNSSNIGTRYSKCNTERPDELFGRNTQPNRAKAQSQAVDLRAREPTAACVPAVVLTLTLNFEAVVAFTDSVAGTEQVTSLGAPVQVNEAVPLIPLPPIESA
jgi:hypothetical protein